MKLLKSLNRITRSGLIGLGLLLVLLAYYADLPNQFSLPVQNSISEQSNTNETDKIEDVTFSEQDSKETKRDDQQVISEEEKEVRENEDEMKNKIDTKQEAIETNQEDSTKDEPSKEIYEELASPTNNEMEINNSTPTTQAKPICDLSNWRYEACDIIGDARTLGTSSTIFSIPLPNTTNPNAQNWTIKAQSRKIVDVKNITVKSLLSSSQAPQCTNQEQIPAVVFVLGGLTGNIWHDFSDVLVPLFINSHEFDREVQFLITEWQDWFVKKYEPILKGLSNYPMINFDNDSQVRCYPRALVGLKSHEDLAIDPIRTPNGYNMYDFRMFVRESFNLPLSNDIPFKLKINEKPRVMLVLRGKNRRFMNGPEIFQALNNSGFEVVQVEPNRDLNLTEFSRLGDSCDVLMGAHGAGLTNFVFLRTNALIVQIIPYGNLQGAAMSYYDKPATEMKLRYLDYNISVEESTLLEKYGYESEVIKDPDMIYNKQGWQGSMKYYWWEQDIRLNLTRFKPILAKVHEILRE